MSADRLREAARVLRERATNENVPAGPWRSEWGGQECAVIDPTGDMVVENTYRVGAGCMYERSDVEGIEPYIATMHPGVALALADWLDDAASWESVPRTVNHDAQAHRIADLILGDATRWEWKPGHGWIEREVTR